MYQNGEEKPGAVSEAGAVMHQNGEEKQGAVS